MSVSLEKNVAGRPRVFDPASVEAFRFLGRDLDPASMRASLRYAFDDSIHFEEVIEFPGGRLPSGEAELAGLERALDILHVLAGVSYYKAAVPERIIVENRPLSGTEAAFYERFYLHGLGEFAYENDIDLSGRSFAANAGARPRAAGPVQLERRTAVPVGGGKDSIVAIELLRRANEPMLLLSVGDWPAIRRTVERAGLPHVTIHRRLAPEIAELNAAGAYNGHVPITGVLSAVFAVAAFLYGFDAIALANERSASAPNLHWRGLDVNHQWSKGIEFERSFRELLAEELPGLDYFSALRPVSELGIARAFARLEGYHHAFTSCNTVFRRDPARRGESWCGECPKCRFVFLILAPFLSPEQLTSIFARDLLAEPEQIDGFRELLGIGSHKPFECVGEVEESVAAVRMLREQEAWRDHVVVRELGQWIEEHLPEGDGRAEDVLAVGAEHFVPERLLEQIHACFGP